MLSYPSSLPGHSDFPYAHNTSLASFTQLESHLLPLEFSRNGGISSPTSIIFHRMPLALPRVPVRCLFPFFPDSSGFLPNTRGSACITANRCLSLNRTLSAIPVRSHLTKLHHSLYATACGFGRHPWPSTAHISHGHSRYRVGASSARVLPHEPALCLHIQKGN